jgi:hypothetical protein
VRFDLVLIKLEGKSVYMYESSLPLQCNSENALALPFFFGLTKCEGMWSALSFEKDTGSYLPPLNFKIVCL